MSDKRDLEENLFGDLELSSGLGHPEVDIDGFDMSESKAEPAPVEYRSRAVRHALKQPPRRDLTGLWIALGIFVLLGGGGVGAMFFLELGPFAKRLIPNTGRHVALRTAKKRKKLVIQINSEPAGASVYINGKSLSIKTPYRLKVLFGRKYAFILKKEGFVDTKHTVDGTKTKEQVIVLNLKLQGGAPKPPLIKGNPGVLFLECLPVGANIIVAGFAHGGCTGKPKRIELQGDKEHIVKIATKGYNTYEEPITVAAGEIKTKKATLEKGSTSRRGKNRVAPRTRKRARKRKQPNRRRRAFRRRIRGFGQASISCSPTADVYWKGKKIGRTPFTFKFPAGRQRLVLKNRRLGALRGVAISIKPRKLIKQSFKFRKGKLKFIIRPWADVYLNGRKVGQTPIRPRLVYEGFHQVELRMNKRKKKMRVRVIGDRTTPVIHIFN